MPNRYLSRIAIAATLSSALWIAGALPSRAEPAAGAIDELLNALGGSIPFPPEAMMEKMSAQGIEPFGMAVVPHGRSLERRSTDYRRPRSMVAYYFGRKNEDGEPIDPNRFVFVAYTPAKHQLEIIGGTSKLPQDFRLVSNYGTGGSGLPARPHAGPGLCLGCHQNGAPIFPAPPWNETNLNPAVYSRLYAEKMLDPFAKRVLELTEKRESGLGLGAVSSFDQAVRIASLDEPAQESVPLDPSRPNSTLKNRDPSREPRKIEGKPQQDPLLPRSPLSAIGWKPRSGSDGSTGVDEKSRAEFLALMDKRNSATSGSAHGHLTTPQLFTKYCVSCHFPGPASPAPPLPLQDRRALRAYVGAADRTVLKMLSGPKPLMPPPGSPALPTEDDRRRMIEYLSVENASTPQPCKSSEHGVLETQPSAALEAAREAARGITGR